ncbi:WD40 repeat domain-containing protein [Nocardioides dilutus]
MRHAAPVLALTALLLTAAGCSSENDGQRTGDAGDPSTSASPDVTAAPARATPPPDARPDSDGSIYFAAQAGGGPDLSEPVSFEQAEFRGKPTNIYLSRRGQPIRRITATSAAEHCPRVSPDDRRLAYLEGTTLVVVPLDAAGNPGPPQLRLKLTEPASCPQWSPDGRRLGYLVLLGDGEIPLYETRRAEVHAATLDGRDRVLASFETQIWHQPEFAWSPDGDQLVWTTEGGVWRAALDRSPPEVVWRPAEGDPSQELPMAFDQPVSVAWLRPGEVVFTVLASEPDQANNPYGKGTETRTVHVVDLGSGRVQRLQELPDSQTDSWSPDGTRLAVVGTDGRIWVHDRATGATSRVAPRSVDGDKLSIFDVGWSPDGRDLLGIAWKRASGYALFTVPGDGSSSEARTPWTWALDWIGLDDVDWSSR